jgi:hypothetical protein
MDGAMVIGERFAWAHLPKTGGTATTAMFAILNDLVVSMDSPDEGDAHATFGDRAGEIAGKRLVLNFRRLPSWVLSRAYYVSLHGVHPDFEPIPFPPADELADSSLPDDRLALFTDDGRLTIDRWLRAESLPNDFIEFASELRPITEAERTRVTAVGRMNALDYDHEISRWFTAAQIEHLYRRNPAWAAVEGSLYEDPVPVA